MEIYRSRHVKDGGRRSFTTEVYEWLEMLVLALVVVVFLFSYIFRVVTIVGPSMNPTLWTDQRVVVSNFMYEPEVGDIVVFALSNESEPFIKRIIAKEGQTVDFDLEKKMLMVDGEYVDEPFINEQMQNMERWYDPEFYPLTVPTGRYYVMGDNRNHSMDSRNARVGTVDGHEIVGRALWIIYPFSNFGALK